MHTRLLEQAIAEQNPHWANIRYDHIFKRLHRAEALADLALDEMQIITGIRRCGKSTLLQSMINHLMDKQAPKSILYINFDDPNYNEVCNNVSALYDVITTAEKLSTCHIDYLLLDEIQNVEAWEQYAKSMYDNKRFKKIILTGSNADLLNSDYATLLTGRYIETKLYPMTYQEVLINQDITDRLKLVQQKTLALKCLDDMLTYGSFPRIHQIDSEPQKRKVLKSYYETILLKDCIKNHRVRDTKTLINLAHYLISNAASRYSYNSLSKALQSNENTVREFIQIFENAYFIHELKEFSYSLKKQTRAKKKTYCIDNGLLTATTFKFFDRIGKLLENLVYTELRKMSDREIYFFHDAHECDFIVHDMFDAKAIQVCYQLDHENRKRELNGLLTAMDKFSIPQGLIITYDQEEVLSDYIQVVPFWKFFSFF